MHFFKAKDDIDFRPDTHWIVIDDKAISYNDKSDNVYKHKAISGDCLNGRKYMARLGHKEVNTIPTYQLDKIIEWAKTNYDITLYLQLTNHMKNGMI
jgi:hypothetical protein